MLDNHIRVHIRRASSHSHMTYAETVPSWFLLNIKSSKFHEIYCRSPDAVSCESDIKDTRKLEP